VIRADPKHAWDSMHARPSLDPEEERPVYLFGVRILSLTHSPLDSRLPAFILSKSVNKRPRVGEETVVPLLGVMRKGVSVHLFRCGPSARLVTVCRVHGLSATRPFVGERWEGFVTSGPARANEGKFVSMLQIYCGRSARREDCEGMRCGPSGKTNVGAAGGVRHAPVQSDINSFVEGDATMSPS